MWLGNPNNPGMFPKNNPQKNCSEQGVSSDFANTHQGKCLTPEKKSSLHPKKSPKHVPSKQSKKMFHHLLSFPYLSQHPLGRLRPVECHPWPRHVQATQRRQAPVAAPQKPLRRKAAAHGLAPWPWMRKTDGFQ